MFCGKTARIGRIEGLATLQGCMRSFPAGAGKDVSVRLVQYECWRMKADSREWTGTFTETYYIYISEGNITTSNIFMSMIGDVDVVVVV